MVPVFDWRRDEIGDLLGLDRRTVLARAGNRLRVFPGLDGIHAALAHEMAELVARQNVAGEPTRFILPVGPTGQYPIFVKLANTRRLDLSSCWFFFMDEYADGAGRAFSATHPLSFARTVQEEFVGRLDPGLGLPAEQIVVPNERNISELAGMIDEVGGIDACFGGIGIHGHLAFNEPEAGVERSDPRLVELNDYTTTINAIRAQVGGNLEGFPRLAYTVGLRQILRARRIRLACRNGIPLDWANTVLRLTLFGTPGDDYPCTYVTAHKDLVVFTDEDTLRSPHIVL